MTRMRKITSIYILVLLLSSMSSQVAGDTYQLHLRPYETRETYAGADSPTSPFHVGQYVRRTLESNDTFNLSVQDQTDLPFRIVLDKDNITNIYHTITINIASTYRIRWNSSFKQIVDEIHHITQINYSISGAISAEGDSYQNGHQFSIHRSTNIGG